ncbi:N-acetylmuramoyl-L-alanine amidase [Peredibacter sp. HCB2-198]|uniref:N-acetylmuramoyl-L-alanine amidase family protein n=1 Tax=Peredibacter sp. HCB2-198 TaxID=3383025 RepID=UPI0038B4CED9
MKFLSLCFLLFSCSAFAKVVLIDPGHGGEEVGAVGRLKQGKVYEKDLSLRLSKKIKDELSKHTSTYLTRSIDRTVSLQERADLADLVKADLFLSIHFNSSTNSQSHGFELYYLDNNSNVAANKVERAENLNLKGEELIVNQILVDLVVQQTVTHSRQLASLVHEKVRPVIRQYRIDDRGVKPGLFYVLALSKRPGLLVEAGFVSNPNELKKVNEEKYLNELARSISAGVLAFINAQK